MRRLYGLVGLVVVPVLVAAGATSVTLAQSPAASEAPAVTFHKDVLPILQKNCQGCHRPGQIAPMSLLTYADARPWARSMKAKVSAREMPPWFADPSHGVEYATDRSLKQADIDTIVKWVDGGAVAGSPSDAPPPVKWPEDGWVIRPDVVVRAQSFKVPAHPPNNVIEWTRIIVPTGFTKDTWVTSIEIKPSNLQVTHHICIGFQLHTDDVQYYTPTWSDKPRDEEGVEIKQEGKPAPRPPAAGEQRAVPADEGGETSGGCYLPGNQAFDYRPYHAGRLIPAGADIIVAQHYTPSGVEGVDYTEIGFTVTDKRPEKRWVSGGAGIAPGLKLAIPPNDPNFAAPPGLAELATDAELVMMMPHMHLRGRDMTYTVEFPDGRKEVVLGVPKYDFNWQMQYVLKNPIPIPKGSKLSVQAHYNNSTSNRFNPNPNRWVYEGNMTWEEMMTPFFAVLVPSNVDPRTVLKRGLNNAPQGG